MQSISKHHHGSYYPNTKNELSQKYKNESSWRHANQTTYTFIGGTTNVFWSLTFLFAKPNFQRILCKNTQPEKQLNFLKDPSFLESLL